MFNSYILNRAIKTLIADKKNIEGLVDSESQGSKENSNPADTSTDASTGKSTIIQYDERDYYPVKHNIHSWEISLFKKV